MTAAGGSDADAGAPGTTVVPPPEPGIPTMQDRELVAWREGTRTRVYELGVLNAWILENYFLDDSLDPQTVLHLHRGIIEHLKAAADATEGKRHRLRVSQEGARMERAMSNLDAAETDLLRIAPGSFLLGQVPSVLNQVKRHLDKNDPRRLDVEAIAKALDVNEADKPPRVIAPGADERLQLVVQERGKIVAAARGASSSRLREQTRLQSFRNVVVVATVAMAIAAVLLGVIGLLSPGLIPLCFEPASPNSTKIVCPSEESMRFIRSDGDVTAPLVPEPTATDSTVTEGTAATESTATADTATEDTATEDTEGAAGGDAASTGDGSSDDAVVDPETGLPVRDVDDVLSETVAPEDIFLVELIGLTAAAIAAASAIRGVRGSSEPYGVPVALALLKLPTGAVTAFLGLLLMRGGFVPGLSALDTSAQILAWAIIFGYAQQLFTRLVDQKAHTVLDAVRGGAE